MDAASGIFIAIGLWHLGDKIVEAAKIIKEK